MDTSERILTEALKMFAERGYDSVSIRDIAGAVNIKESSIYYHFKNKQDILDSLILLYEKHINKLMAIFGNSAKDNYPLDSFSTDTVNMYFFKEYLMDPFCNKMMRFMMLEQFKNERVAKLYEYYLFELPYKNQSYIFSTLVSSGMLNTETAKNMADAYFSSITMLTFKFLLNGELTEKKKEAFFNEATKAVSRLFKEVLQ